MTSGAVLQAGRPVVVDGFLDAATCARVGRELDFAWWQESTVTGRAAAGGTVSFLSLRRTSRTAVEEFFPDPLLPLLRDLERRVCDGFGLEPAHLEPWQALRYDPGGRFEEHHDSGLFGDEPGGERRTTVLLYLEEPASGGATEFAALDLVVAPRAGRLVVWRNLDDDGAPDPRVRHRATPVGAGRKAVLTTWERERPVRPPHLEEQP